MTSTPCTLYEMYNKGVLRSKEVAGAGTSQLITAAAYNTYGAAIPSYLCQITFLEERLFHQENGIIAMLFKIPYQSYGMHLPFLASFHPPREAEVESPFKPVTETFRTTYCTLDTAGAYK